MTDRELLQQALDTLKADENHASYESGVLSTCAAIEKRLEQLEPEPVAYLVLFEGAGKLLEFKKGNYLHGAKVEHIPLYTAPPQREWVGLTDEQYEAMAEQYVTNCYFDTLKYAKAIEAKLKEKNSA